MNNLGLTIRLSNEYDSSFEKARTITDLHKCRCWFDRKNVFDNKVSITLTSQGIVMRYRTAKEQIQETCTYDSILSVTEMHSGIMLRLSHKRLLFLPAADNRKDTELLMQAVVILGEHCRYCFKKSALRIGKAGLFAQIQFRSRPNQGYDYNAVSLSGVSIFFICLTLFIATVFTFQPINNGKIHESEAISLVATYSSCDPSYRRGHIKYIDLEFTDHKELTVATSCSSRSLLDRLDDIPAGTSVHLLVHPKSEYILQLEVNGDILLEFHNAQDRIWNDALFFGALGLFMYAAAIGLSVAMIRKKLQSRY